MRLSKRIQVGSPAPAIVALCVALFGISAASAQTYPLPNVGSVNDCASTVRAFAGGHGNQSCAQTQGTVLPQRLKEPSFQAKCPVGQPLRGLLNNTCTDKPNVHPPHPMSSNYNTTLCCGYAQPVGLPTAVPIGNVDIGQAKIITNLPMSTPSKYGCPPLGVPIDRTSAQTVAFARVMTANLDKSCRQPPRGAPGGFDSVVFNSCNLDPRGAQYGISVRGDVTCAS
jgi:hypothetical protein